MQNMFDIWEKEKNSTELKEKINYQLKHLYMNSEPEKAKQIFNSKWSSYIDLSYKEGSILEFCAIMREKNNSGKTIKELKFLISKIEEERLNPDLFKKAIHNILLTAVFYNNMKMIVYITKEQKLCNIDFTYAECAILNNCFPKNNSSAKKDIVKYFIMECGLRITPKIEKILEKKKRTDILTIFEKISFYQLLSQKIPESKSKDKKLKI
jgi:hypothetical protein